VSYEDVSDGNNRARRVGPDRVRSASAVVRGPGSTHWFFRGHDPTTLNRQNNDVGTQYRSEIFTTSDAQRQAAEAVKAKVEKSGKWKRPIVTRIEPATTWVRAEDYHQDYLIKHPDGYNDHCSATSTSESRVS